MNKKESDNSRRKLKRYEKLGAVKFQKLVFFVEETKFKMIKKCFPNFIHHCDKYLDWKKDRAIKRAKSEDEVKEIVRNTKFAKMALRKEMNQGKNRNYHMDPRRPAEIMDYLKWNKDVHQKGLTKDAILILLSLAGTLLQVPGAIWLLGCGVISAFLNFECINIQNYNLCRLEKMEKGLKRREEQNRERNIHEYGEAAEVIYNTVEKSESLPSFKEILDCIDNPEQLRQMRAMFKREQDTRQVQKQIGGNLI